LGDLRTNQSANRKHETQCNKNGNDHRRNLPELEPPQELDGSTRKLSSTANVTGISTSRPKYNAPMTAMPATSDVSARKPGASGGSTFAGRYIDACRSFGVSSACQQRRSALRQSSGGDEALSGELPSGTDVHRRSVWCVTVSTITNTLKEFSVHLYQYP
jgi:hypothetical protein